MTTLGDREAAFTARIAADATHEMRNVLAIVKESAGLIEDIVRVCESGARLDRDRVARTLERIDAQVARGAELMTHLNRFAHSLERKPESIELHREVEQAAFLGRRAARKRRIQLRAGTVGAGTAGTGTRITADSFRVQMAISIAVEWWLPRLPEGATVLLGVGDADGRPAVEVTGRAGGGGPLPERVGETSDWSALLALLAGLGATAEVADEGRGLRVLVPRED